MQSIQSENIKEKSRQAPGEGLSFTARVVKTALILLTFLFLGLFLIVPLLAIFSQAFSKGIGVYFASLKDPIAFSAIRLTLLVSAISVPLNVIFGICAAWALSRFYFPGRSFLISLIDLPFAISPVIAGLMFVLLFGRHGWLGAWLLEHNIKIIFAVPGIIIATIFVTLPFVARELIPFMQEQGQDEELAALSLGASPLQIFTKVTLPNIKWPLLYGIILCNARAMGEFGAVSVVSGHIRGKTNTIPLHVEILYNEYNFSAAFAVASILAFLAILTLVVKNYAERKKEKTTK